MCGVWRFLCIYVYICIYARIRLYVGGSGDCTCMRFYHEVEGISVVYQRVCGVWVKYIYIYINIYIYIYIYVYMWGGGGNGGYMRLEYEVDGKSAA